MKIEINDVKPDNFQDRWPGEFRLFSHYEMALGIPHALFVITTLKENGQPNTCFQSWSSFTGDSGGYFAITPLLNHMHTCANILRTREFCINFMNEAYFDACYQTIVHNEVEADEIAAGGFTAEPARCIHTPRVKEAFMSLECVYHSHTDLSGQGISTLFIGRVVNAAVEESHINGAEKKYGKDGFMYYLYSMNDFATGDAGKRGVAALDVLRNA